MGVLMKKEIRRLLPGGYTLAEIVVVMLIIAVVVGVSIKVTKAKLDSVISYTYYGAYSTLRSATSEIIADYDPNKDIYTYKRKLYDIFNLTPEAMAAYVEQIKTYDTIDCSIITSMPNTETIFTFYPSLNTDLTFTPDDTEASVDPGSTQTPVTPEEPGEQNGACAGKIVACSADKYYNYDKCACVPKKSTIPKTGEKFCTLLEEYVNIAGGTSTCSGSDIAASTTDFSDKTPDLTLRNGLRIYGLKGDYAAIPMLAGNNIAYNTDLTITDRIAILFKKLKRDIVAYSNAMKSHITAFYRDMWSQPAYAKCSPWHSLVGSTCNESGGRLCDANRHEEGSGCFACCTPKQTQVEPTDPVITPTQSGCSELLQYQCAEQGGYLNSACQCMANVDTSTTPTSNTSTTNTSQPAPGPDTDPLEGVNINEVGYIVYVDVDGSKGSSTLWDDVYPFYITLSGRVVPAFDSNANPDGAGGDSEQHLQVSVKNETINAQGRRSMKWLAKSVSFREGACLAGFVSSNTPYCQGMSYDNSCDDNNSDCQIKTIRPVKFF